MDLFLLMTHDGVTTKKRLVVPVKPICTYTSLYRFYAGKSEVYLQTEKPVCTYTSIGKYVLVVLCRKNAGNEVYLQIA